MDNSHPPPPPPPLYKAMSLKLFISAFSILVISTLLANQTQFLSNFYNKNNSNNATSSKAGGNIPIIGAVGPESFAFDPNGGGPYTGVSDGRIIKWLPNENRWIDFAVTSSQRGGCENPENQEERESVCGRPLGMRFNDMTGDLYIADAYMGLLVVGPEGGLAHKIVTEAEGTPFKFTNSLDIDHTSGVIYFTDSSMRYQRREHVKVVASGDNTGRLMRYDPRKNLTKVLLHNLTFPNGVSLSKENDFLLLSETTNGRITKLWLENAEIAKLEVLTKINGYPDNVKRNDRGEYWIGVHAKAGKFLTFVISKPWIRNALVNLPFDITKVHRYISRGRGGGFGVRISGNGDVLEVLENESWGGVSEVMERDGVLYIGSITMPFVGLVERKGFGQSDTPI